MRTLCYQIKSSSANAEEWYNNNYRSNIIIIVVLLSIGLRIAVMCEILYYCASYFTRRTRRANVSYRVKSDRAVPTHTPIRPAIMCRNSQNNYNNNGVSFERVFAHCIAFRRVLSDEWYCRSTITIIYRTVYNIPLYIGNCCRWTTPTGATARAKRLLLK